MPFSGPGAHDAGGPQDAGAESALIEYPSAPATGSHDNLTCVADKHVADKLVGTPGAGVGVGGPPPDVGVGGPPPPDVGLGPPGVGVLVGVALGPFPQQFNV